ncbi:unnamed protein product, partial [Psylliodes chrysocephalus]
ELVPATPPLVGPDQKRPIYRGPLSSTSISLIPAIFYSYHQKFRLQKQHSLLCDELGLTSKLLQTSHAAARLNGYVAGVGKPEDLEKDIIKLGLSEKAGKYLRVQYAENKGGALYC